MIPKPHHNPHQPMQTFGNQHSLPDSVSHIGVIAQGMEYLSNSSGFQQITPQIQGLEAGKSNLVAFPSGNMPEPAGNLRNILAAPQTAPVETGAVELKFDRWKLEYRGKSWRIEKRGNSPFWYLYVERNKIRKRYSLGESAKKAAGESAKIIIDALLDGHKDAVRAMMKRPDVKSNFATFGELFKVLPDLPIRAKERTRQQYEWCCRRALLKMYPDTAPEKLSTHVLETFGEAYLDAVLVEAQGAKTQRLRNRYLRSARRVYEQMLALFQPAALRKFQRLGLRLPSVDNLHKALAENSAFQKIPREVAELPSEELQRRTLREWMRMGRTPGYQVDGVALTEAERRNCFMVIGMALSFGGRKGELAQVQWRWFTSVEGLPFVQAPEDVQVKNNSGKLEVTPLDPFWSVMWRHVKRNHWRGADTDFVLVQRPGCFTDRTEEPFLLVGKWMRWLGWKTQKTNHALRDWAASLITMKYGLGDAAAWARHADFGTTQRHYNRFVDPRKTLQRQRKLRWLKFAGL
jgi:hypothetical protein